MSALVGLDIHKAALAVSYSIELCSFHAAMRCALHDADLLFLVSGVLVGSNPPWLLGRDWESTIVEQFCLERNSAQVPEFAPIRGTWGNLLR